MTSRIHKRAFFYEDKKMNKKVAAGIALLFFHAALATNLYAQPSFDSFWRKFSTAVFKNDRKTVAALTRFPLKDEGENDEGPNPTYSRAKFLRNYNLFFNRGIKECFRLPKFYLNNNDPTEKTLTCAETRDYPMTFMFKRYKSGWRWINFNRD